MFKCNKSTARVMLWGNLSVGCFFVLFWGVFGWVWSTLATVLNPTDAYEGCCNGFTLLVLTCQFTLLIFVFLLFIYITPKGVYFTV